MKNSTDEQLREGTLGSQDPAYHNMGTIADNPLLNSMSSAENHLRSVEDENLLQSLEVRFFPFIVYIANRPRFSLANG